MRSKAGSNNNGPARLLVNQFSQSDGAQEWLQLQLRGRHCNPDSIGARVRLKTSSGSQVREVRGASSYLSQNEFPLHFGLGEAGSIDWVEVRWPCGRKQRIENPAPGRRHHLVEPPGD